MSKDFLTAIKDRRSYYEIAKEATIPDSRLKEILAHAVKHTPSAFNSQSARVVLLLGSQHDRLWDMTKEALRKIVPPEQFSTTEEKINGFRSGYGTVLYFEDQKVVEGLQQQFALYKDNFPVWSLQSSGMLQLVIWTALENEGFGASLQHYNELIETDVKKAWNIPDHWKLLAQMPFGKPTAQPGEKDYSPLDERFKIFE
jgi:predicted oxidoreductase (fatty acid repression mutant protein)